MSLSETSKVLSPSFTGKTWSGLSAQAVEERGSTVAGSLPTMPASAARSVPCPLPVALRLPKRCTLSAVALASWSGGQLRAALVEVVGDPHRADRVRAGGPGAHLVELLERRHHRPLRLLHDVEVGRDVLLDHGRRRRGPRRLLLLGRRAARDHGRGADHGAPHHERAPVHARGNLGRDERGFGRKQLFLVGFPGFHGSLLSWLTAHVGKASMRGSHGVPARDMSRLRADHRPGATRSLVTAG